MPVAMPKLPRADKGSLVAQRYVIEGEIARGGMGVVYKVTDLSLERVCALKRIQQAPNTSARMLRAAFEREFQVLASLDHPGIIRAYSFGVDADGPYYTMELVEGRDLRNAAPIPWREVCSYLRDVAGALSLLHVRRLLHGDLSPANVKITPEGRCKLLDFGALRDFGYPKMLAGTPPMIAPESLGGTMLDQRTDLYALGALAYFSLTGRHAYPATNMRELESCWRLSPPPPSRFARDVPSPLDALVMSLLSTTPLARPTHAAEVIVHLDGIAELAPEPDAERARLARSYLAAPPFIGRDAQLAVCRAHLTEAIAGRGAALCVEGPLGSGRTRFLEEVGLRAQIAGATVLKVDASMHPSSHGTSRALVQRLLEALPQSGYAHAPAHGIALAMVGIRVSDNATLPPIPALEQTNEHGLHAWFLAVSAESPLVLQIDNVAYVDDASLGLLSSLARDAPHHALLLMVVDRSDREGGSMGLRTLKTSSTMVTLSELSAEESLAQTRSMFGDAPNLDRFAGWLYSLTSGNPLLCVELSRQLVERGTVRYEGGMWLLPSKRPLTTTTARVEDLLSARIAGLSEPARTLARCLCLQQVGATFELCVLVSAPADQMTVLKLLDELAQRDVLHRVHSTYSFSSVALREVFLDKMTVRERDESHLRLGRAFVALAGGRDRALLIEAGRQLVLGGCELEGAELIESVVRDEILVRKLSANMVRIGPAVETALQVYKQHRRPDYERMGLLAVLCQAGFYEDPRWHDLYADDALDLLERRTGLGLARSLRHLGCIALMVGLSVGYLRFLFLPRRARYRTFLAVLTRLFHSVTSTAAVAIFRLDGERVAKVAAILRPFAALPGWMTAPSFYVFCQGLRHVARDDPAQTFAIFDEFSRRLEDPRYMRMLPADARPFFIYSSHFARGVFATFRADGAAALASIARLERSGLRMFEMIGSQLHFLYHAYRGELARAIEHRAKVEVHAAHFGSAWQVELWEAAAMLPLQVVLEDATAVARLAFQLDEFARSTPTMKRYARLAQLAVDVVRRRNVEELLEKAEVELGETEPRSFIGWCTAMSVLARTYNSVGRHQEARTACDRALATLSDADREYVGLFLAVDIEAAHADAGLGDVDGGLARLDVLLARYLPTHHPLALGLLHEARARIALRSGREELYEASLHEVEARFARSENPALVAKCERLRALRRPVDTVRGRRSAVTTDDFDSAVTTLEGQPKLPG